ncbi:MAG TPA: DUF5668 domain-containing protein [Bryobacteraceae bacterium]|nr:DUF5668 domain-containing protein [Bryobacteraceae bacterium]
MVLDRFATLATVAGGTIVVSGLLLMLNNLHVVAMSELWTFWPLVPVVLGLAHIADSHTPFSLVWGGLAAAIGALLFLDKLDLVTLDFNYVWPMIVVAFGITMFWKAQDARRSS